MLHDIDLGNDPWIRPQMHSKKPEIDKWDDIKLKKKKKLPHNKN
jgi:hypothetical protein